MSMANGTVGRTASVAALANPHQLAVTTAAVNRAVRRDLDRFLDVLADPVTSVRRAALADHVGYVLDQLETVHRFQDDSRGRPRWHTGRTWPTWPTAPLGRMPRFPNPLPRCGTPR